MTLRYSLVNKLCVVYDSFRLEVTEMGFAKSEEEIGERVARFIKAELKRADLTYDELAERLKEHGLTETRNSITAKLKRGTFPATFLIAVLAAIGRETFTITDV
jgi:hypothetical protein